MRLASRTPARSSMIGTRTLMCTGPSSFSLASTITRRYLGAGFCWVAVAAAAGCSPCRAPSRRSASSALIFPVASISRICRRSSVIQFLQFFDGVISADLSTLEPLENFDARWLGVGVDEVEAVADAVETCLDGRVADPEDPLHLLYGAV